MEEPGGLTGRLFYYLKITMTKLTKASLVFVITLCILLTTFTIFTFTKNTQQPQSAFFGSVPLGGEYHSTTTRTVAGIALTSPTVLNTGPGALGSVVITGAGTGVINVYDGTTTTSHSDSATTTIATIPASAAAGTYTFDALYYKGLIIEIVGSAATSTITYR